MEEQFSGAKDRVSGSLADLKEIFVRELGAKGKVHWSELEQMLDQSDHELLDSRTGPPGTLRDGRANISTPLPSAASSESPVSKTRPRIQLPATAVAAEARSKLLVAKAAARARRQRLVERSRELGIEVSAVGKDLIDRVLHDVGGVGIDDVLEKTHLGMSDLKRSIGVHFQGMPRLLQVYGRGDLRAWRARSTAHVESNRLEVYHGT